MNGVNQRIRPCRLCGLLVGVRRPKFPCAFCEIDVLCDNCVVTDDPSTAGLPWCGECATKDSITKEARVENRAVGAGYFVAVVPGGSVPVAPGNKSCYICSAEYGMLRWKVRCVDCKRLLCDGCMKKIKDGLGKGKLELCPICYTSRLEGTVRPPYYEEEGRRIARERSSSQVSQAAPPQPMTPPLTPAVSPAPAAGPSSASPPVSNRQPSTAARNSAAFDDYLFASDQQGGGGAPSASASPQGNSCGGRPSQPTASSSLTETSFVPPWEPPSPAPPPPGASMSQGQGQGSIWNQYLYAEQPPSDAAGVGGATPSPSPSSPSPDPRMGRATTSTSAAAPTGQQRYVDAVPMTASSTEPSLLHSNSASPAPVRAQQRHRADSSLASTVPQPYDSVSPSWSERMSRRESMNNLSSLRHPSLLAATNDDGVMVSESMQGFSPSPPQQRRAANSVSENARPPAASSSRSPSIRSTTLQDHQNPYSPQPTSSPHAAPPGAEFNATSLEALPGESDEDFARRLATMLN